MKIHLCLYLLDNSTHALSNQIILIIHQLALHNQSITNTLPLAEIINENIAVKHVTNCLAAKITLYVCVKEKASGDQPKSQNHEKHTCDDEEMKTRSNPRQNKTPMTHSL